MVNSLKVYIQQGAILANESKQSTRIGICTSCPNLQEDSRCKLCGCFMGVKVRLEAAKCPAQKW